MPEHPAELMRRAAARLAEAHAAATPPPWRVSFIDGVNPAVDEDASNGHMVAEMFRCGVQSHAGRPKADAELIALLRNSAESLAGWLEMEAERASKLIRVLIAVPPDVWCRICDGTPDVPGGCECWDGALATARAILGEATDGR